MNTDLFASPVMLAHILVILGEDVVNLLDGCDLLLPCLVCERIAAKRAAGLLEAFEVLLDPLDVLEAELGGDDVHVAAGVDVALDVDDLCVVKCTDDLEDAVDGTDMGEEGVAETCTC